MYVGFKNEGNCVASVLALLQHHDFEPGLGRVAYSESKVNLSV